ncbi:13992_t:CDS:2 [Acaulospora colombiana]|uniref:13992_t:CDS:1 n=1 Tax=Acaulospora colombiana TaxID=27376 RepID=A0ACA9KP59_9GLOM|nr:13992_t:CDS:2 [Acaulospora colombiana]
MRKTASAKGLVAGDLKIYQKNKTLLDCSSVGGGQGKGYPDVATRQLVKALGDYRRSRVVNLYGKRTESQIPILGFFDNDPYGVEILSVYKFGSQVPSELINHLESMPHETANKSLISLYLGNVI